MGRVRGAVGASATYMVAMAPRGAGCRPVVLVRWETRLGRRLRNVTNVGGPRIDANGLVALLPPRLRAVRRRR